MKTLSLLLGILLARAHAPAHPPQGVFSLSETEARYRKSLIQSVRYELHFEMQKNQDSFLGRTTIHWEQARPTNPAQPLTLDLLDATLQEIRIDNRDLTAQIPALYNGRQIALPDIPKGKHKIEIRYTRKYSIGGKGFYRFVDPEDQNEYFYTHFEPFYANQLFPAFDQPDLKATFKTSVLAPSDWVVISNYPLSRKTSSGDRTLHKFQTTRKIPTYVVALAAGPYHEWKDPKDPSQKLYARKTMAKYVDAENWFRVLSEGKKFFRSYFGHGMPYPKYDQIIVPDFNSGAMENVGAVTFSERFVFRSPPTRDQLRKRAEVILHELAHMWFGNWVTLEWWDGLWLNESFATFAAIRALEPVAGFTDSWLSFTTQGKSAAYFEDAIPATHHPVHSPVASTDQAFANFDSITYGKGASVLKQLAFTIGEEAFKSGLKSYFQKHQDGNARLEDFFSAMEKAHRKPLKQWQEAWIQTSGFDTIEITQECGEPDRLGQWKLEVRNPAGEPRFHRFLVKTQRDNQFVSHTVELGPAHRALTLPMSKNCEGFILINEGDHGYFSVKMPEPLIYEIDLKDELDQAVHQQNLWLSWMTGNLPGSSLFRIVEKEITRETNATLLRRWFSILLAWDLALIDALDSKDQKRAFQWINQKAFQLIDSDLPDELKWLGIEWLAQSDLSQSNSDLIKRVEEGLKSGRIGNISLKDDIERRWSLIRSLCKSGAPSCELWVEKQYDQDPSLSGRRQALGILAEQPSLSIKKKWIQSLSDPEAASATPFKKIPPPYSEADIKTVIRGIVPYGFTVRFGDETDFAASFLKKMTQQGRDHTLTARIAEELYPRNCLSEPSRSEKIWEKELEGLEVPLPARKEMETRKYLNRLCSRIRSQS